MKSPQDLDRPHYLYSVLLSSLASSVKLDLIAEVSPAGGSEVVVF